MREPVKCKNCGIKWLRVTTFGTDTVLIENLQYLCPNCHSNWCEPEPEKRNPYPQVIIDEASEIADAGVDAERTRIVGLFDAMRKGRLPDYADVQDFERVVDSLRVSPTEQTDGK